jgi:HPt (histidine-containing phosphotransfer) domain-containing protein
MLEKFDDGSLSEALVKLSDAYDTQDTTLFRQAAHKLTSAAGYVGATLIQRCCKEIQNAHTNE